MSRQILLLFLNMNYICFSQSMLWVGTTTRLSYKFSKLNSDLISFMVRTYLKVRQQVYTHPLLLHSCQPHRSPHLWAPHYPSFIDSGKYPIARVCFRPSEERICRSLYRRVSRVNISLVDRGAFANVWLAGVKQFASSRC